MTNTVALREVVSQKGLKYKFIADCLGISAYGLQKKIDNSTEFKASEVAKLSELLQLTAMQRDHIFLNAKVI